MSETMIRVENVSKKFCRSLKRGMVYTTTDVARDLLGLRGHSEELRPGEFWSVQDVSFELKRGECLGLIGANGAGKSTLLKMLNGIIQPDRGSIRIHGRVGALIEVGAGFHPMLTGRENIYVNGAILGMSRREIDRKFDQIVEFSGLEPDILDAPVKTYSSGMYVRLGFAIAVHTDPDILLVDEVLAVGDARFTGKCRRKIDELRRQGTCLIFVSHSLSMVEEVCSLGMMMEAGRVQTLGSVRTAISAYRASLLDESSRRPTPNSRASGKGSPSLYLIAGEVLGEDGNPKTSLECGERATLRLTLSSAEKIVSGVLSVWFLRSEDRQATGVSYLEVGRDLPCLHSGELNLRFYCQLVPGEYRLGVTFSTDGEFGLVDEFMPCTLLVEASTKRRTPFMGTYMLDVGWESGPYKQPAVPEVEWQVEKV
jgi:lipopolysaccharide transport system ATP-binding protein